MILSFRQHSSNRFIFPIEEIQVADGQSAKEDEVNVFYRPNPIYIKVPNFNKEVTAKRINSHRKQFNPHGIYRVTTAVNCLEIHRNTTKNDDGKGD